LRRPFSSQVPELFTIGHSTHSLARFLELLRLHRIEAVADVRSSPYSGRLPQFNREFLQRSLREAGIRYVFLGDELGASRAERECYEDGVARYERIVQTAAFLEGLGRVRAGARRFRAALACAEQDPLECHRTILVCRHLRESTEIRHILHDGTIESQEVAEARLMAEEKVSADDLFTPPAVLLARAYDRRGAKIAYHERGEPHRIKV
jgi:uncharacterized protein (DUF488 family)